MRSSVVALFVAGLAAFGCKSSSGSPVEAGNPDCPSGDQLISDFELDNSIAAVDGRQGGWYTYHDDTVGGHFANANGYDLAYNAGNPNCTPGAALHVMGTGFATWGAAMGVDWKPRPQDGDGGYGDKTPYDASKYRGVSFWARAATALDGVQVSFPDIYTDGYAPPHDMPDPAGGSTPLCTDCKCIYNPASVDYNCSPYIVQFGRKGDAAADVTYAGYANVQINTTWQLFKIYFVDTRQDPGNGGYHPPSNTLTVNQLTAMAIQVNADYSSGTAMANNFEIWLDDVGFIK